MTLSGPCSNDKQTMEILGLGGGGGGGGDIRSNPGCW